MTYVPTTIYTRARPVASGGAGGAIVSPVFGQTVNPISTRGADYAHHSTTSPPGFSDIATALSERPKPLLWCQKVRAIFRAVARSENPRGLVLLWWA